MSLILWVTPLKLNTSLVHGKVCKENPFILNIFLSLMKYERKRLRNRDICTTRGLPNGKTIVFLKMQNKRYWCLLIVLEKPRKQHVIQLNQTWDVLWSSGLY